MGRVVQLFRQLRIWNDDKVGYAHICAMLLNASFSGLVHLLGQPALTRKEPDQELKLLRAIRLHALVSTIYFA